MGDLFSLPANWLGLCEFRLSSILCAFVSDSHFSHTLALREARALRAPELYVFICVHTHSAALPRFPLWCLRLLTSVLRWKSIRM